MVTEDFRPHDVGGNRFWFRRRSEHCGMDDEQRPERPNLETSQPRSIQIRGSCSLLLQMRLKVRALRRGRSQALTGRA